MSTALSESDLKHQHATVTEDPRLYPYNIGYYVASQLCLTSKSPVDSVGSPENHTAALLQNPADFYCHLGQVLLDERVWTLELRPDNHS